MGTTKTKKTPRKPVRETLASIRDKAYSAFHALDARLTKLTAQQDGDRAELQRLIRLTEQHGRLFESGRASDNATVASLRRELTTVATRCASIESGLGGAQWKAQGQPARWITLLSTQHLKNILAGNFPEFESTKMKIAAEIARRAQDTTSRAAEKVSPAETPRAVVEPNTIEVDIDGVIHTNPKTIALRPDGKGNIHNPDLIVLEPKKLATGPLATPAESLEKFWDLANEQDFGTVHIYSGTPSDPLAKCLMSYKLDKPPEFAPPKESILEEVARRRKAGEKCELRFGSNGRPVIMNLETPQEEYARRTKAGEDVALIWDPIAMKNGVQAVKPQKTEAERRLKEIMDERMDRWQFEQRNVFVAQRKEIDELKRALDTTNARLENHRLELDTAAKTTERVKRLEKFVAEDVTTISQLDNRMDRVEHEVGLSIGAIPTTPTATVQVDFATLGWRGRFCVALSALAGGEGVFRPKEVQS